MKKEFCLIGDKLNHSLSCELHRSLFELRKINANYHLKEIKPEDLSREMCQLKKLDGFNVTIPYKTEILKYLDEIDLDAESCGAVNTVVKKNNKLIGYNTDIFGFDKSVQFHNIKLNGAKTKVCVWGFGGAAKAIVFYLLKNDVDITVAIRNWSEEQKEYIKNFFVQSNKKTINVVNIFDGSNYHQSYELLINATPVGLERVIAEGKNNFEEFPFCFDNISCVYDLVYNPLVTPLLNHASKCGCKIVNGENMLMWQAIKSQQIWFG